MIQSFDSLMLRTLLGPLLAAMQIFAVYVLLHGHYSPGGGFVAGILLGASMILPRLALGKPPGRLTLTTRGAVLMTSIGVVIFTGVGLIPVMVGYPVLDYSVLPLAAEAAYRRSIAILLVEVGVTLGVAGAMLSIFYGLAGGVGQEEKP